MCLSESVYVLADRWTGARIPVSVSVCQLPVMWCVGVAFYVCVLCVLVWAVTSFYFWFLALNLKLLPFGTDSI